MFENRALKIIFIILAFITFLIWLILAVSLNPASNEKH
jgi:flagellar biogenesis protein FliO